MNHNTDEGRCKNTGDQGQVSSLDLYVPSHLLVKGRDVISRVLEPRPSSQILMNWGPGHQSPSTIIAKDLRDGEKEKCNQCSHKGYVSVVPKSIFGVLTTSRLEYGN